MTLAAIDPDWGVDWMEPGAMRAIERATAPKPTPPSTVEEYVHRVRALLRRPAQNPKEFIHREEEILREVHGDNAWARHLDWRLIAAGFGLVHPNYLAKHMALWLAYWEKAAPRPWAVGSPYNPEPRVVMVGWLRGLPRKLFRHPGLAQYIYRDDKRNTLDVTKLLYAARALSRTSAPKHPERWSLRALALLGRLSPEAQRLLVFQTVPPAEGQYIRPSDLPWAALRSFGHSTRGEVIRTAWSSGRRLEEMAQEAGGATVMVQRMVPNFPAIHRLAETEPKRALHIASRLARGETPAEVSGGVLTRAEASRWLQEAPWESPLLWLITTKRGRDEASLVRAALATVHRHMRKAVTEWLAQVARNNVWWNQLIRERQARHQGQTFQFRLLSRIDELRPEDIAHGSPENVFNAAGMRVFDANWEYRSRQFQVLCRYPSWWAAASAVDPGIRMLCTPQELKERGEHERHCVGTYCPKVERGESYILVIDDATSRSTAEVSTNTLTVLQHRGPANSEPAPQLVERLNRFLEVAREAARKAKETP